ncbi:methionyl-tRNA formyltransferase [Salinicoccus halitifaciens]|uniref:Methionyl-tRNA formyltransferase n=1 Tax=Salinicoccus halitifaciens TaxID=1073415 RepID=A0ABV2E7C5_9STAP|nr:methionyl-tRNA formyltransferase [Salinicoccus halitifaciens]MCD2136610.1 methionyl-tRNA formyltransferase [Salinicoccus halitifaciens]
MPNIIFMGTPDFSVPILKDLNAAYGVDLVVSQPDKPVGRKRIMTPPKVAAAANELDIEVYQPENIKDEEAMRKLESIDPDIIVTAAYGQILPKALLELPKHGAVNVHASLLPKFRGGAPIHHAVMAGAEKTGITIMYMAEGLDSGDIISQREIPILEEDDTGALHDKLSRLGSELLLQTLPSILEGSNESIPQDHASATYSPNISKEDERLDLDRPAQEVFNHIRGLSPFPGAYTKLGDKRLKIYGAKLTGEKTAKPAGEILGVHDEGFLVAAGDEKLLITEVQLAGKKRTSAKEFIQNRRDLVGQSLG